MKTEFEQSGVEFLKALSRHADLIMNVYLRKEIPAQYDDKTLESLIAKHILWRPSSHDDLQLTKTVRNLLEFALQDVRNRQIDSSIGDQLAVIKTTVSHYKEACNQNRRRDSEDYLKEITQRVFGMMESLHNNLRMLWTQIHNEFALVATLRAKIRENELAQTQVTVILACLEMLNFAELSELVGNDRDLRRLLVVSLQREVESCAHELREVQQRLLTMLGRFRKLQQRSKIIRGFDLFLAQHPDYVPRCYPEHPHLTSLFNHIEPLNIRASADVTVVAHETLFTELIQSLNLANQSGIEQPERTAQAIEIASSPEKIFDLSPEQQALESFFCYLAEHQGKRISALDYYQKINFAWDAEFWLFGVLGYLESMGQENRDYFDYQLTTQIAPVFNGNRLIEDVCVWMN
jgi:hypothetical protein